MPITRNPNINNAVLNPRSRYTQGGDTDRFRKRLGFWDRYSFPLANDDVNVVVTSRTQFRPDLVAFDLYQQAKLQWFVLQYNSIVDINEEFIVGKRLVLPTPQRLLSSLLSRSTGGTRVDNV